MKPVLAVMNFENKAGFSGQWKLGEGMADLLNTDLMRTKKVVVLERQNLDDVVGEIVRQGQELFRKEGRVERGRLKNAQYLVRGTVTDFTVAGDVSGWFSVPVLKGWGRSSRSRVAINLKVSDVTSGEVVSSVKAEGTASAGGFGAQVNYRNVAFGGDAFFRTPLGHATEDAIRVAVKKMLRDIPVQFWQPRVAEAGPDEVIINGGKNVNVREGAVFIVREPGRDVTDPVTGNVIERVAGRVVGRLEVKSVNDTSAHAVLLQGKAQRGDFLEEVGR